MTSMTIRDLDPERDADAAVALVREVWPTVVTNAAAWRHREATIPARARHRSLVAEVEGRVVGRAQCRLENLFSDDTSLALIVVAVTATHRGKGIGSALYGAALEHARSIGSSRLITSIYENEPGLRFARARGFAEERSQQESVLDPRTVAASPASSVDLQRVADVDPRLVHAVDEAATRDMPSSEQIDAIPYDEWVDHVLEHPLFTTEGSVVALVDGVAAAVSFLVHDQETRRAANMFTGTLREYRGRGLALAVKLGSIHWAAENGVTSIVTTNDATNAPMLAVNKRLGYRPSGRHFDYVRDLTA
jgi:GNAT superfamily N-acetyltransferase